MKTLLLLLLLCITASAQVPQVSGTAAPIGACVTGNVLFTNQTTGQIYDCVAGAWNLTAPKSIPALSGDVSSTAGSTVVAIGSGKVTNAMLAGGVDAATKLINVVPFANGGNAGSAATSATTGTMTVSMATRVITITPTGACTFNASGGIAGQTATFVITTAGATSFVLTWGTNFRKVGTLATGTVAARTFTVTLFTRDRCGLKLRARRHRPEKEHSQ